MIKRSRITLFLVPEAGDATVKYFNKFSKFYKFIKMDVSHKIVS